MKTRITKCILGVIAFTFVLTGCSKNSDELSSITSIKTSVGYIVKDGYLLFDSRESYISTIDKVANFTDLERNKWETEIGFLSQQRIVSNIIIQEQKKDSLNRIKFANADLSTAVKSDFHSEEYYSGISKGIIKLKNEGTSDEYWDYSAFNRGFTNFINEEGLFAVGDSLFQVTNNELKVIKISSEPNKLSLLKALNNNDKRKVSNITIIQKMIGNSPGLRESSWVENSRWPNTSQRIKIGVELTYLYFTPYTAQFDFKHNFYVQCQKTNVFNSWIYYGTPITLNGSWTMLVYYYPQRYSNHTSYSSSPSYLQLSVNPDSGVLAGTGTTFSILPNSANQSYTWEFQAQYQPLFESYSWSATRADAGLTASLTYN